MAKYRVWAHSISDVYIDIEAETEEQALEAAKEVDGGDFHEDIFGCGWEFVDIVPLEDGDDVDFTYDEIMYPE